MNGEKMSDFPYTFNSKSCKTCNGMCCRGFSGYVWLDREEIMSMADTMNMDIASFSSQYVRQVQGRLSLLEHVINGEHFCCFFAPIDCRCTIYQNRPKQCRTFPFWDRFKEESQRLLLQCPGVSMK